MRKFLIVEISKVLIHKECFKYLLFRIIFIEKKIRYPIKPMQDRFMILFMIVLAHISRLWGVECQYRSMSQDRLVECSRSLWEVVRIEHKSLLEKH